MRDNRELLFNVNEIIKTFAPLRKCNVNDVFTFNHFAQKIFDDITPRELDLMEETVDYQIKKDQQISNTIISGVGIIIATMVGCTAIIFSLDSYEPNIFSLFTLFIMVISFLVAFIALVNLENHFNKKYYEIKDIIRVLKYIQEVERSNSE